MCLHLFLPYVPILNHLDLCELLFLHRSVAIVIIDVQDVGNVFRQFCLLAGRSIVLAGCTN